MKRGKAGRFSTLFSKSEVAGLAKQSHHNEGQLREMYQKFKKLDSDGDGKFDCFDNCPADPNKFMPGICGCGVSDALVEHLDFYPTLVEAAGLPVVISAAGSGLFRAPRLRHHTTAARSATTEPTT